MLTLDCGILVNEAIYISYKQLYWPNLHLHTITTDWLTFVLIWTRFDLTVIADLKLELGLVLLSFADDLHLTLIIPTDWQLITALSLVSRINLSLLKGKT